MNGGDSMGIHDGHRERMKERFKEHGLQSFSELNALELLLFYAIPRRDTNELAHALINRFGSLGAGSRRACTSCARSPASARARRSSSCSCRR